MKKLIKILINLLPFIFVFLATLHLPADPDLGWHLKYGQHFFKTGQILRDNSFSNLMPDYKWANTSWVIDLLSFGLFHNFGFLGLTLGAALIITLTFYFFSKLSSLNLWGQTLIFPIIIFLEKPVNEISFRGQLTSILFLGILFYLLHLYETKNSQKVYLTVPLFLFWINLHGQFILGLGLFLAWIGFYLIRKFILLGFKFNSIINDGKKLGLIFLGSLLATLINPFGLEIYKTTISHFSNPDLKYIAEYLPFEDLSVAWWNQIVLGILIVFGIFFLFFGGIKKNPEGQSDDTNVILKNLPQIGIISILYGLTFFIRRYAWSLYYLTMPFLKPVAEFFTPDSEKNQQKATIVILTLLIAITIFIKIPFTKYLNMNWDEYCSQTIDCSVESAEFLKKQKYDPVKLFTLYDWGGFLIWNYPEIKPTIDGRMHLWRDEKGYSGFDDYYGYERNRKDIDKSSFDLVYISPHKPIYQRMLKLVAEKKWQILYQDQNSLIFKRNVSK